MDRPTQEVHDGLGMLARRCLVVLRPQEEQPVPGPHIQPVRKVGGIQALG